MKKLLIIAIIVLGLTSCSESYPIRNSPDSMASQFINLERITKDNSPSGEIDYIFRDRNTDVLYFVFLNGRRSGITPIAEPDGTFLTYQEWKERNKTYGKEIQE